VDFEKEVLKIYAVILIQRYSPTGVNFSRPNVQG
jgi:hypothetical protein